mmetsp:Transcript_12859/g.47596  ORF Transcript_12859/g.47596 Transcript_12859/m.47596 type:complete len:232 (-) Transcript_12859:372-1067(-)
MSSASRFTEIIDQFERANCVRILWLQRPNEAATAIPEILMSAEHLCLRNDAACATRAINKLYKQREERMEMGEGTMSGNMIWIDYFFPALKRVARILGKRAEKTDEDIAKIIATFVSLTLMSVEELGGSKAYLRDCEVYQERDFKIFFRQLHRSLQWLLPLQAEALRLTEHDRYVIWKWIKLMLMDYNDAIRELYAPEVGGLYFEFYDRHSPWYVPELDRIDVRDMRFMRT